MFGEVAVVWNQQNKPFVTLLVYRGVDGEESLRPAVLNLAWSTYYASSF